MRAEQGGAEATKRKADGRGRGRSLWLLPEVFFLRNSHRLPPGRLAGLSPAPSHRAGHRELGFPASLQASGFQLPERTGLSRLLRKGKARAARARHAARASLPGKPDPPGDAQSPWASYVKLVLRSRLQPRVPDQATSLRDVLAWRRCSEAPGGRDKQAEGRFPSVLRRGAWISFLNLYFKVIDHDPPESGSTFCPHLCGLHLSPQL